MVQDFEKKKYDSGGITVDDAKKSRISKKRVISI